MHPPGRIDSPNAEQANCIGVNDEHFLLLFVCFAIGPSALILPHRSTYIYIILYYIILYYIILYYIILYYIILYLLYYIILYYIILYYIILYIIYYIILYYIIGYYIILLNIHPAAKDEGPSFLILIVSFCSVPLPITPGRWCRSVVLT